MSGAERDTFWLTANGWERVEDEPSGALVKAVRFDPNKMYSSIDWTLEWVASDAEAVQSAVAVHGTYADDIGHALRRRGFQVPKKR